MPFGFRNFSELAQQIAETRSTNKKIQIASDAILQIETIEEQKLLVRFLGEGAFKHNSGDRISIGHKTIAEAACDFLQIDYDYVFRACKTATGSATEAIEKLMENWVFRKYPSQPKSLNLNEIEHIYLELKKIKKKDEKVELLHEIWSQLSPLEIKYFIRVLYQYSLRIGFEEKSILRSIALAFNKEMDDVRYAYLLTRSLEETLEHCSENKLKTIKFSYFSPLAFMLATPLDSAEKLDLTSFSCEEKFDGMRCQAHINKGEVKLFSRDLNDITATFPEVTSFFLEKDLDQLILDGEICVFEENTIQPFQRLQKRMGVKKPSKALLQNHPVTFIAYDILAQKDDLMVDLSFDKRRKQLELLAKKHNLPISITYKIDSIDDLESRFQIAKNHGNEGLMLKRWDSTYQFGQRVNNWYKVKEPNGSLDTILLYAHAGSGKRGGTYSDFTLGIRDGDWDDGRPKFIPIGKAYGGYTDDELKRLNKEIKPLIMDRFGPTLGLKPEIVIELEYEEIQLNKRTKAGYTLRLPRFKAIRWDLSPHDVDTLNEVKRQYNQFVNRERMPNTSEPFTSIHQI